jgi:Fe-S cluster biogenesis protein NfuA
MNDQLEKQIEEALSEVRPVLARDGGGVQFVKFDESTKQVTVRFEGACQGCPMAQVTLESVIGAHLKEKCPFISEVIAE